MQLLELKLVLVHALLKTGSHYRTRIPPLGAEGKYLPIIAGRFYCLYRHKHRRIPATWLGILTQTSNEKVCVIAPKVEPLFFLSHYSQLPHP